MRTYYLSSQSSRSASEDESVDTSLSDDEEGNSTTTVLRQPVDLVRTVKLVAFYVAAGICAIIVAALCLPLAPLMLCVVALLLCLALIKEILEEIYSLVVYWGLWGVRCLFRRSAKNALSLAEGGCVEQQQQRYTHVDGEYLAVDIAAVDLASIRDGALIRSLPTSSVKLPIDDVSRIAGLSWRWDFDRNSLHDRSLNVAAAIRYAKRIRIQYLFINIISLDQTLEADLLIPQVARFGTLYATIPVIAA
ncbi:hypothetical protein K491DRAFT_721658 [Lophiostoma macrostomum CBS 122681]|uniref:Uncharacterized protein n=1 Tax=Lophiostoma macrostomum CBS 122681 TaxID=1314788 RepID=A0A6A6SNM8_9PLEO|nr:hypothetical protein K491DRAFT_721658 [Lophiostoma macrostomum CBS 122681]